MREKESVFWKLLQQRMSISKSKNLVLDHSFGSQVQIQIFSFNDTFFPLKNWVILIFYQFQRWPCRWSTIGFIVEYSNPRCRYNNWDENQNIFTFWYWIDKKSSKPVLSKKDMKQKSNECETANDEENSHCERGWWLMREEDNLNLTKIRI